VRAIRLFASKAAESIIEGKKNRISKELLEEKSAEEAGAAPVEASEGEIPEEA